MKCAPALRLALTLAFLAGCAGSGLPGRVTSVNNFSREQGNRSRTYRTKFPLTEDPISEGGRWLNGASDGFDWTDVRTTPRMAFGTMPGDAGYPQEYADSTAVLKGKWGAHQSVHARLRVLNPSNGAGVFEEVELRVRTKIVPHSITGYEINCSVNPSDPYMQVVKWNGPLANFTLLDGRGVGCADRDVLEATASGRGSTVITVYKNGAEIFSVTDDTAPFTSGSPGIGFFLEGATGLNAQYGFSLFYAKARHD